MNPVLVYAIEHEVEAGRLLAGYYRIPFDDVEDVAQNVIVCLLRANPSDPELSNPWKARAYWSRALQSAVTEFWRQSKRTPPLSHDRADRRQDPEAVACASESVREAWAIAWPAQRRAIVAVVSEPGKLSNKTKVNLCRLRRRIRERAAA